MTRRIGTPTRLGVPVTLYPDEWLHSAISRWAWDIFGVSRAALFDAFGLADIPQGAIIALGTRLLPEVGTNIAIATGIPVGRLREATMERLDQRLLSLNAGVDGRLSATVSKHGAWSWQAGTRYCPDCMHARPGVFQIHWRSPWVFACLIHRRILLDACPWCQGEVVEMRGRNTDVFDPSTCRSNTAPSGSKVRLCCRARLEETWEHSRLEDGSAPLLAQQSILLREQAGVSLEFLHLLQSAATGLRGAKAVEDIAVLSGFDEAELRGFFDDEIRVGVSAPKSAYAMAALIGAAHLLVSGGEGHVRALIRRTTFSRPPAFVPRGAGHGPGSPYELLSRWPGAPAPFAAQILRAHDQDLTISQRILWDTSVDPRTLAAHGPTRWSPTVWHKRIPEQLWPEWCSRLDVGGRVGSATLAAALSTSVGLVGTATGTRVDAEKYLARILRPNMLGTPEQTSRLLAGLSELAHTVDSGEDVIDYPRRLQLPVADFLTNAQWSLIAESISCEPGKNRRHRNARRYLWQRITGSGTERLPEPLRVGQRRADAAEYTDFRMRLTSQLQAALDAYGLAFLRSKGIREPVTWTPGLVVDLSWPGPEVLDLDVSLLHEMLRGGVVVRRDLAKALGVSRHQVLRAIDLSPPTALTAVVPLDWSIALPPQIAAHSPQVETCRATSR